MREYSTAVAEHAFPANDGTAGTGFCLHMADVFVAEWMRVADRTPETAVPHASCLRLLRPFVTALATTQQAALLERIRCAPLAQSALFCFRGLPGTPLSRTAH